MASTSKFQGYLTHTCGTSCSILRITFSELKAQRGLALPLMLMNLTGFAKMTITTAFLGRLGPLMLAGGGLGFTFANVTGFSVLNGLCFAMDPICGQAYGAQNFRLLHKTLLMAILLLLAATVPITFLWLSVDKILIHFGQQDDISAVAKRYLIYLLPNLLVTSFLAPLKSYMSSQGITVPIMFTSALSLAFHVPINILLVKARGLEGVATAVWVSDLLVLIFLALFLVVSECFRKEGKWKEGGWWEQGTSDWLRFLKLCGPCCLTTCLEWWCYEILVLLSGRLPDAKQAVGVIVIVLNFDYLLYSVMLSLVTCTSTRVSNELGANRTRLAYRSGYVSLGVSVVLGCFGALAMVGARGVWGPLFSNDQGIVKGVKKTMLLMAIIEVANFPLAVSGGIVRGTARPSLAMYANVGGFYLLALPLGVVLAFRAALGLAGLLIGFLAGVVACLALLLVFIARIDWDEEARKAQILTCNVKEDVKVVESLTYTDNNDSFPTQNELQSNVPVLNGSIIGHGSTSVNINV